MTRSMISMLFFVLANAAGLLVAAVLVQGFSLNFLGFFIAAIFLSLIEAAAGPLIAKASSKNLPRLQGGIALVTTFVGLWVTDKIVGGMTIAGLTPLLAATLVVWIGSVIADIVLPMFLFKTQQGAKG